MKLNVISDLHCELGPAPENYVEWFDFEPEKLEPADYLIVAGDTGYATTEREIIRDLRRRTEGKFKNILTIKGNHSYWVPRLESHATEADFAAMAPNDTIDLVDGGVAIIGTTLWTNRTNRDEILMMNDYKHIPTFTPELKEKRFAEESEFIRNKWLEYKKQGLKVVIVTHHNPRSCSEMPEDSRMHEDVHTAYWVSHKVLDDIKPDLWICGHIHENFDGEIDGVRIVRHPIGYRWGWYEPNPNSEYGRKLMASWYNKIVEIDA